MKQVSVRCEKMYSFLILMQVVQVGTLGSETVKQSIFRNSNERI